MIDEQFAQVTKWRQTLRYNFIISDFVLQSPALEQQSTSTKEQRAQRKRRNTFDPSKLECTLSLTVS